MADIGVLNLEIHDNSKKAAEGLDHLAEALGRVKAAVSGGLKLASVSFNLKKLATAVNDNLTGSVLDKITQLTDALSKLQGLGNINIKINGGSSVRSMVDAIESAQASMGAINTGFDEISGSVSSARDGINAFADCVRETEQLMQSKSWTYGAEQFGKMFAMWSKMRSAMSLGPGTGIVAVNETGWTEWKDGAIEVEGTVSDCVDNINGYLEGTNNLLEGIVSETKSESAATDDWLKKAIETQWAMKEATAAFPDRTLEDYYYGMRWEKTGDHEIGKVYKHDLMSDWLQGNGTANEQSYALQQMAQEFGMTVEEVKDRIEELRNAASAATPELDEFGNAMSNASHNSSGMNQVNNFIDMSQLDLMKMKLDGMKEALAGDIEANKLDNVQIANRVEQIRNLSEKIDDLQSGQEGAKESTNALSAAMSELGKFINGLKITQLFKQFKRIATYRLLRSAITEISKGFSEGVQNVYNYSKAIGSDFYNSMDNAASSLLYMKNSIGAAVAPLLQSLIPVLQSVINWFVELINYVNQFIALLRGQSSWTKAINKTTSAYDQQTKSAKKASNAVKELLADWDELNIIQSQTGGGGGSIGANNAEDYLNMFEETNKFESKVREVVDFIKDNMGDILNIAKKIGLAILAWKASSLMTGLLSDLSAITAAGLIIGVTWDITTLLDRQYMKTGDEGWLVADAITNLLGATLAGTIISKVLGGAAGLVTAGIELTVSAGISYGIAYLNEGQDSAKALEDLAAIKAAIGYAAMAVGFGIASGSAGIGLLLAAEVAAPLFVLSAAVSIIIEQYRSAEEIAREAFAGTGKSGIKVDEVFKALQDELDKATEGYSLVIEAFSGAGALKTDLAEAFETVSQLSAVVRGDGKLTQKEADEFNKAWETVFSSFEGLAEKSFDTVFAGLNRSLSSENGIIREQAKQLRISMLMLQENLSEAMAEFKLEQQDLADKIGKGTATSEEVETYFRNLELVAKSSRNSLTDLKTVLSGREKIDFGDSEHAADNAVQFIKDAQEASTKATEEIEEGYKSEIDALDNLWSQVELANSLGKISDEEKETYKQLFDDTRENFTTEADRAKQKVTDDVQSAYTAVIEQAMSGLANVSGLVDENGKMDYIKLSAYMTEIMLPILSAAKDAGAQFSEDFGKMFGMGVNLQDWIGDGWAAKLEEYVREKVLGTGIGKPEEIEVPVELIPELEDDDYSIEDVLEEVGKPEEIEVPVTPELEVGKENQVDKTKLQSLVDTYGSEMMKTALEGAGIDTSLYEDILNTEIEVPVELVPELDDDDYSIEDVLEPQGVDRTKLQSLVDQYGAEMMRAALEGAGIDTSLYEDILNPEMDVSGIEKPADSAASSIEGMASRIRAALASLDGITYSMDLFGQTSEGAIHFTFPKTVMMAGGGIPKSGDLVMANENGKIEMMGSMGTKPVVANNQQIVNGISSGVASANEDVVSELRGLSILLQRVLNKEFVARAVPSSSWGKTNMKSAESFERVTG